MRHGVDPPSPSAAGAVPPGAVTGPPPRWLRWLWGSALLRRQLGPLPPIEEMGSGETLRVRMTEALATRALERVRASGAPLPDSLDSSELARRLLSPPAPATAAVARRETGSRAAATAFRLCAGALWSSPLLLHAGWILLLLSKLSIEPGATPQVSPLFLQTMEWVGGGRDVDGHLRVDEHDVLRAIGFLAAGMGLLNATRRATPVAAGKRLRRRLRLCLWSGLAGTLGFCLAAGWPVSPGAGFDPGLPLPVFLLPGLAILGSSALATCIDALGDWLAPPA